MQGFPLFLGFGRYYYAAARVVAGDVAGLPELLEALTLIRQTGYQSPGMLILLAETQQAAGQLAEARATVAAALAISAQLGQPVLDADLQRLDGELILATGGAPRRPPLAISKPSTLRGHRRPSPSSCALRSASRGCGGIRANAPKRATYSPRSTRGSPRASTPAI